MTAFADDLRSWPLDDLLEAAAELPRDSEDAITDLTGLARFGLRGKGTAAFAGTAGLPLPMHVNGSSAGAGYRLLRLGQDELLMLAEPEPEPGPGGGGVAIEELRSRWMEACGPKGFDAWREETWAWLSVSGPGALAALPLLTAADTRAAAFGPGAVLQTRAMNMDAVLFRSDWRGGPSFDLLFDMASAAFARDLLCDVLPGFRWSRLGRGRAG